MKSKSFWGLTGLLALALLGASPMCASGADVRDGAGLFSPSAVKQAEQAIRTIQKEAHKDLVIETFPGIPENRLADYERDRERFFTSFLNERARLDNVDGVYVMLMKEPPPHNLRMQVGMGQATAQRAFRPADREQLIRSLQPAMHDKQYDDALRQIVSYVERTMKNNLGGSYSSTTVVRTSAPAQTSHGSSMFGWLAVIFMFIVGFVVVAFVIRLISGGMGGGGGGYSPGYGGGGGGGFFSSLLGGIGGAMAGSWLYDRFFSNNANAGTSDTWTSRVDNNPGSDIGSDFSSSGRDTDDGYSSGGSDSGADFDSGGGDSGGGSDSGGGDF